MNFSNLAICTLVGASLLGADTLLLRSGARVEGSFLGGDARSVRFAQGAEVKTYNLTEITSILFNGTADNQSQNYPPQQQNGNYQNGNYPVAQNPAPAAPANNAPSPRYEPLPPPPAPSASVSPSGPAASSAAGPVNSASSGLQVPAGSQIVVRLIDSVDSQTDHLGQTYRVSIDQPVIVNGQTAIPSGADALAKLVDAQQSGRIAGRTVMTLDLRNVTVNGKPYEVVTTGVPTASNSRGARSAKVIGGTAALGAIIGGIAGGGKGAGIGTLAGAGAGTAAEVATSGQRVRIPSETRLTFTLQNPLDL